MLFVPSSSSPRHDPIHQELRSGKVPGSAKPQLGANNKKAAELGLSAPGGRSGRSPMSSMIQEDRPLGCGAMPSVF
jgi:hypothetical protein